MSKTAWIIFIVITIGILVLLVVLSGSDKIDVSKVNLNTIQTANKQNGNIADHVYGKVGSKVTLISYGDFQCPACGAFHPTTKEVTEKYKSQLQFVFRNFPLTSSHPNAMAAAGAVEAAGLQGKYWEMYNKIYESQSDWSELSGTERDNLFKAYAVELGLNSKKFTDDLVSTSVSDKIKYDQALGYKAKVEGTPTFYLNGALLDSKKWNNADTFESTIVSELKKANIPLPQ